MKVSLAIASILAAGALASSPAHARVVTGTVTDVSPVSNGGGRQVCEPAGGYYERGNDYGYDHYDQRNDRYYDDRSQPRDQNRVAGAVAGAVIGGVLGNQVGGGDGRRVATAAGAIIGGLAGREIQGRHQESRYNQYDRYDRYGYDDLRYSSSQGQRCWTDYSRGSQVVAYDVTFRAEGRYHTTRLNYAPRVGSRIRVDTNSGW